MSAAAGLYTPATLVAASVRHLLRQGRSAIQLDSAGNVLCRYLADDGLKCAIGGLIPEDLYSPKLEEATLRSVLVSAVPGCMGTNPLSELDSAAYCIQKAHDGWGTAWRDDRPDKAIQRLDDRVPGWREALADDEVNAFINLISAPPS